MAPGCGPFDQMFMDFRQKKTRLELGIALPYKPVEVGFICLTSLPIYFHGKYISSWMFPKLFVAFLIPFLFISPLFHLDPPPVCQSYSAYVGPMAAFFSAKGWNSMGLVGAPLRKQGPAEMGAGLSGPLTVPNLLLHEISVGRVVGEKMTITNLQAGGKEECGEYKWLGYTKILTNCRSLVCNRSLSIPHAWLKTQQALLFQ